MNQLMRKEYDRGSNDALFGNPCDSNPSDAYKAGYSIYAGSIE